MQFAFCPFRENKVGSACIRLIGHYASLELTTGKGSLPATGWVWSPPLLAIKVGQDLLHQSLHVFGRFPSCLQYFLVVCLAFAQMFCQFGPVHGLDFCVVSTGTCFKDSNVGNQTKCKDAHSCVPGDDDFWHCRHTDDVSS